VDSATVTGKLDEVRSSCGTSLHHFSKPTPLACPSLESFTKPSEVLFGRLHLTVRSDIHPTTTRPMPHARPLCTVPRSRPMDGFNTLQLQDHSALPSILFLSVNSSSRNTS
jgi:hypothetical protein